MYTKAKTEQFRVLLLILVLLTCMLTFSIIQPFGDGPDEINRFKIVNYIYEHGTLPVGDDPEVLLDGYGGSYAFQPMLTYMIDGYLLRCLRAFNPSLEMRVFLSRLVNVFFGCLTAIYTKKISDLLFFNKNTAWAFTLAVVFLPQNLFIHTYVNTDSMGLLSIAIVLHALLLGMKEDFSKNTCVELAIGIIICALSYYNCYGIIVCAVLFFMIYFSKSCRTILPSAGAASQNNNSKTDKKNTKQVGEPPFYDIRALLRKGLFISVIVLLGISWWFIRNAILYDGDFLALEARNLCAAETGLEAYNPYTRDTYQRLGIPLTDMIFKTDYFTLVWKSFIAMFGPMLIPTHHYIYLAFRDLFFLAVAGLLIPIRTSVLAGYAIPASPMNDITDATISKASDECMNAVLTKASAECINDALTCTSGNSTETFYAETSNAISTPSGQKWLVHVTMLLGIIIPVILALYYSYTFDFQPQGRYYLPMVIPFMYFMALGTEKMIGLISIILSKLAKLLSGLLHRSQRDYKESHSAKTRDLFRKWTSQALYHLLYAFFTLCLLYATFASMLGYYQTNGVSLF